MSYIFNAFWEEGFQKKLTSDGSESIDKDTIEQLFQYCKDTRNEVDNLANKLKTNADYGIEEVSTTTGYLKSYQLFKVENGVKTLVGSKIDIPTDFFLKEVNKIVVSDDAPIAGLSNGTYLKFVFVIENGEEKVEYQNIESLVAAITAGEHIEMSEDFAISAKGFLPKYDDVSKVLPDEKIFYYDGKSNEKFHHGYIYEKRQLSIETDPIIEQKVVEEPSKTYTIPSAYNAIIIKTGSNLIPVGVYVNPVAEGYKSEPNRYSGFKNGNNIVHWIADVDFDEFYNKMGEKVYDAWAGKTDGSKYIKIVNYDRNTRSLTDIDGNVWTYSYTSLGYINCYHCYRLNDDGTFDRNDEVIAYNPTSSTPWIWRGLFKYDYDGGRYTAFCTDYIMNYERHYQWDNNYSRNREVTISGAISYVENRIPQYINVTDWVQIDAQPRTDMSNFPTKDEMLAAMQDSYMPKARVVSELPDVSDAVANVMYLVPSDGDFYNQFMLISGSLVRIGSTKVSFDKYEIINDALEKAKEYTDAEIEKLHAQNTDTKLVKGLQKVEVTDTAILLGHYPDTSVANAAVICGNGTAENPHNAWWSDWNGNIHFSGDVEDGSGNVLSNKMDISDLLVDGQVMVWNATTNQPQTITPAALAELIMPAMSHDALKALYESGGCVEGLTYRTYDDKTFV